MLSCNAARPRQRLCRENVRGRLPRERGRTSVKCFSRERKELMCEYRSPPLQYSITCRSRSVHALNFGGGEVSRGQKGAGERATCVQGRTM